MALLRCFSTLGCPTASLEEVHEIAHRHDLPSVELRALNGTLELANHFSAIFQSPAMFAARLRQLPARVGVLDTSARLVGGSEVAWEELEQLAPWADAAGIPWLRVFDGGQAGAGPVDDAVARARRWKALREERGWQVDILVETHDSLVRTPAVLQFCAASDVSVLWDAHHTWKRGGEDPVVTWQAIGSRVRHIHVKDSRRDADAACGWRYALPGTGEFPMKPLLAALSAADFTGAVSLEWERHWVPSLPPLEAALASAESTRWW